MTGFRPPIATSGTPQRSALIGLATLTTLATAPLFTHHMLSPIAAAEHGHIVSLCLVALHALLTPVHGVFHLLFLSGLVYAIVDRVRAWHVGRRTLSHASWRAPNRGDPFWSAAEVARVDPDALRILADSPTPAFTIGWWRPTIYVAEDASLLFEPEQLAAVLEHEQAHVRRRDPLRLSLLRFLSCMLYWLPLVRRLAADLADEVELRADRASTQPVVLASAILASAQHCYRRPIAGSVGLHGRDLIDRRVRQLLGEAQPARTNVTRMSLAGGTGVLAMLIASALVVAHPEPAHAAEHERHCEHHGNAFVHLFCMFDRADGTSGCPHATAVASADHP